MNRLVGALGQSHFGVYPKDLLAEMEGEEEPPAAGASSSATVRSGETVSTAPPKPRPKRDRNGDGEIGFDIGIIEDQAVVTRVTAGSTASRAGVSLGWILDEIDGSDVETTIERFRGSIQSGEVELMLRHALLERLRGEPGDEVDLVFIDARENQVRAKLTLERPREERFRLGNLPPMAVEWDFERMGEVAYFRLSSFFAPAKFMPLLREFVEKNLDAKGFIIDLRGNPGGLGFMANGICGLFVEEGGRSLGTMTMRDGELNFAIYPQATTYSGPLAVLIDSSSASTSEILAGGLRDIGRARIFGTRTAGAALPSVFERLPNGDAFQYAIANYVSAGGEVLEGKGVAPHQEVRCDRKELLEGRDPVIEAALGWIRDRD
jgi:carboxyl-terminal processing protease